MKMWLYFVAMSVSCLALLWCVFCLFTGGNPVVQVTCGLVNVGCIFWNVHNYRWAKKLQRGGDGKRIAAAIGDGRIRSISHASDNCVLTFGPGVHAEVGWFRKLPGKTKTKQESLRRRV
jgi:hypothetical protein